MDYAQLITGQPDMNWVINLLTIIVLGIVAYLFKDIKHEFKEIKNDLKEMKEEQQQQALNIARIDATLESLKQ